MFLALAVGGTIVAALYSGKSASAAAVARKVLYFPPFVSLLVGIVVGAARRLAAALDAILDALGATLVPIALFSVGLQFRLQFRRGPGRGGAARTGLEARVGAAADLRWPALRSA